MKYYTDCLDRDIKNISDEIIAEKIFLIYPSYVFRNNEDLQYNIYKEISEKFKIPITSIQLCGSGKVGYSYYKLRPFDPLQSDLDIAIINSNLFNFYMENILSQSNDLELIYFSSSGTKKSYTKYISKGWLRPDFMPNITLKTDWFQFFGFLSNKYSNYFAKINAGIFLSESIFRNRQKLLIDKYRENKISILNDLLNIQKDK
ncbi:hypothetical protein SASC598P14_005750 [Snodgrassella alvi SCGC AB-598-P14]|nr:hypothetical protein SASC598P14_005750 [Snodgrassella alvi SCGC AB-598-P14]